MSALTIVILIFAVLAAVDYLFGSRLSIGKEFEKGFMLLGTMALSMIGMIVISPLLADFLSPAFDWIYNVLHLDPSIVPAALFANDMGGAPLAVAVAKNADIGEFNGLVVASMMGATVSFTIPFSLQTVNKEQHSELLFGLLCGIVTIPIGCFVAGIVCGLNIFVLFINLLPLLVFSLIIALGLLFAPNTSIKIFKVFGWLIKALIVVGLVLGMINFLGKGEIIHGMESIENAVVICLNASIVMSGMLPLIYIISKLLKQPLEYMGGKLDINGESALGLFSSLATSYITFGVMKNMDKKGVALNSAFAVSAAFTFAEHMAFTMAFNSTYLVPMIVGKLVAGVCALVLAIVMYGRYNKKQKN